MFTVEKSNSMKIFATLFFVGNSQIITPGGKCPTVPVIADFDPTKVLQEVFLALLLHNISLSMLVRGTKWFVIQFHFKTRMTNA